jgi:hypothetical protein
MFRPTFGKSLPPRIPLREEFLTFSRVTDFAVTTRRAPRAVSRKKTCARSRHWNRCSDSGFRVVARRSGMFASRQFTFLSKVRRYSTALFVWIGGRFDSTSVNAAEEFLHVKKMRVTDFRVVTQSDR